MWPEEVPSFCDPVLPRREVDGGALEAAISVSFRRVSIVLSWEVGRSRLVGIAEGSGGVGINPDL